MTSQIHKFLQGNLDLQWKPVRKAVTSVNAHMRTQFVLRDYSPFLLSCDDVTLLLQSIRMDEDTEQTDILYYAVSDAWLNANDTKTEETETETETKEAESNQRKKQLIVLSVRVKSISPFYAESVLDFECAGLNCRMMSRSGYCSECNGKMEDNFTYLKDLATIQMSSHTILNALLAQDKAISDKNCLVKSVITDIDAVLGPEKKMNETE